MQLDAIEVDQRLLATNLLTSAFLDQFFSILFNALKEEPLVDKIVRETTDSMKQSRRKGKQFTAALFGGNFWFYFGVLFGKQVMPLLQHVLARSDVRVCCLVVYVSERIVDLLDG
jgi:hypothetical protein